MKLKEVRESEKAIELTVGELTSKLGYKGLDDTVIINDPDDDDDFGEYYRNCDLYLIAWIQSGRLVKGKIHVSHEKGVVVCYVEPQINKGNYPWPIWRKDSFEFDVRNGSDDISVEKCLSFMSDMAIAPIGLAEEREKEDVPAPGLDWEVCTDDTVPFESFYSVEWEINPMMRLTATIREGDKHPVLTVSLLPLHPLKWENGTLAIERLEVPMVRDATKMVQELAPRLVRKAVRDLQAKAEDMIFEGQQLLDLVDSIDPRNVPLKAVNA